MKTKFKKSTIKLLLSFNKLLIFPLLAVYMAGNSMTLLYYFSEPGSNGLWSKLWCYLIEKYGRDKGIDIFWFWENLALWHFADKPLNQIYAIIFLIMISADIFFSIQKGRKPVVKWIFYVITMIIILFIAFVASPVFYEYAMDVITSA
ncbi:MAG: hypothetical protein K2J32_02380 [Ruminococcus sp.]|nr:hypothetical protein [Ruminococcus sp.]